MMHIADNQDALLDYLYEEGDPAERMTIARHLQECAKCSVAVLEYQTVRGMLSEWTPPAAQLGFRIVQDAGSTPRAAADPRPQEGLSRGWGAATFIDRSRWAQAAAAVVLFAAGMAVSQLDVEYGQGALILRSPSAAPATARRNASIELPPAPQPIAAADAGVSRPAPQPVSATAANDQDASDAILRRMREMIAESEIRQQRELALRLSQVAREVDTQHRADLLRIEQNIGEMEMQTGAQINHQQQQVDYLVRTSGTAK